GINHGFPDDLDILLVAPDGKGVILMSDAGAGIDLAGVNLTFTDSATLTLPDTAKINSGQYKPTNHGGGDTFAGAPSGPYGTQLESFIGIVPNGDWQLYIVDDGAGDGGNITRWSLSIETTIPADPVAELAVSGSSTPNPVFVGQNFFYTITVTNGGPAAASNLRLTSVLATGVTLVNSIPAVSSSAGSELTFNLGNLAVGASQVVVIEAVSSASGTPTNVVSVVSDQLDLQNQNNSVAIGIRVNRVTMLSSAGVSAPGGPFALSILGQPGLTYVIEVSTNLVNWTPIFTNTTLDGVLNFTDTGAAGAGQRFYRAVER
ncbi:MAG: conserved repeat domain, partial [Verrucomicrobia bacterium]|nr:conserved repeat domain [Verrucomicrobiota bacterium]